MDKLVLRTPPLGTSAVLLTPGKEIISSGATSTSLTVHADKVSIVDIVLT